MTLVTKSTLLAFLALTSACASTAVEDAPLDDAAIVSSDVTTAFVEKLAENLQELIEKDGSYGFDYGTSEYARNIEPVARDRLPSLVRDTADQHVRGVEVPRIASWTIKFRVVLGETSYRIVRDGKTLGYLVPIAHNLPKAPANPADEWDGSGVHLYVGLDGHVIKNVNWVVRESDEQ